MKVIKFVSETFTQSNAYLLPMHVLALLFYVKVVSIVKSDMKLAY